MIKLLERKDLKNSTKIIYIYLSELGGEVELSFGMLARRLGMSKSTINLAIRELESKKGIRRVERIIEGTGEHTSNKYIITSLEASGEFSIQSYNKSFEEKIKTNKEEFKIEL